MNANELRIGNWVHPDQTDDVVHVCAKDFEDTHHLCPIKLTEEWLVKFGFVNGIKRIDEANHLNLFNSVGADGYLFYIGYPYEYAGTDLEIKHVHQLQNLYFALTGEELEIKE